MPNIVVCCLPAQGQPRSSFPEVRGYYLAESLRQLGVEAEFRHLPCNLNDCEVVISSDYQMDWNTFRQTVKPVLEACNARLIFGMADYGTKDAPHFSKKSGKWYESRGGILCHLMERPLEPYEHYVGLGIEQSLFSSNAKWPRDTVVFDFPLARKHPTDGFTTRESCGLTLAQLRTNFPRLRLVGTGPANFEHADCFDVWFPYGVSHLDYIRVYERIMAFVVGCPESLGLQIIEAQTAGGAVIHQSGEVKGEVLTHHGSIIFRRASPQSLQQAIDEAQHRSGERIALQARGSFNICHVARRIMDVIRFHER